MWTGLFVLSEMDTKRKLFEPVGSKADFPALEREVMRFWKEDGTFQESLRIREGAPRFVFYEGPPTANGNPGTHHILSRAFKDVFGRYQTMKGRYVERKAGWDVHGLPVELEVEKELKISGKQQIEAYGIAAFNQRCRESVHRYVVLDLPLLLHPVGLVGDQVDVGPGPGLQGLPGGAVLPSLRDAAQQPRAVPGLSR